VQRSKIRGLAPGVGVVLLVAVTVVLSATAGVFFAEMGNANGGMPTAALDHTYHADDHGHTLVVRHKGGDGFDRRHLLVFVRDGACVSSADDPNGRYRATRLRLPREETHLTAGSSLTLNWRTLHCTDGGGGAGQLRLDGAEVTVTWVAQSGDESTTLYRWQGPSR
jgi:hypothetical protein